MGQVSQVLLLCPHGGESYPFIWVTGAGNVGHFGSHFLFSRVGWFRTSISVKFFAVSISDRGILPQIQYVLGVIEKLG